MYVETVYGILPISTWSIYRAKTLRAEAAEMHRNVVTAEIHTGTFMAEGEVSDIQPIGGF